MTRLRDRLQPTTRDWLIAGTILAVMSLIAAGLFVLGRQISP